MSEIRYDRLNDSHVIIAPERLHRPDFAHSDPAEVPNTASCPFCDGNESMTPPEIFAIRPYGSHANENGWQSRVVPNLYKAVQIEAPHLHHFGLNEYWEGFGAHEVIIDTPHHHTSMEEWSREEIRTWLKTLGQRVADLRRDFRIEFISLFKNEGFPAGSTQPHSHTQLIGLPLVPKTERERLNREVEYFHSSGQSLLGSMVQHEEEAEERIIGKNGQFSAYCPYASSYPFEVVISSSHKTGQIDTLGIESIDQISHLLYHVLKRLKHQLGALSFNLWVATPPLAGTRNEYPIDEVHRFAIRIMPRLYRLGGFEMATGVMINPVAPEVAAKLLKEGFNE